MTTLAEQIATLESRLAAYESRKVPLSADDACRIWEDDPDDRIGPSCLAVARAALVAAESPAAVEAALAYWVNTPIGANGREAIAAAIRAAHDAAIDGGCGAARESDGPPWLADAAEALGQNGAALNWSQVISEIRELVWQRDGFRKEADDLRLDRDVWQANANAHRAEVERAYKERDDLRRQLDALTRPIDGVEELGRIGWRASLNDERANPEMDASDIRQAQAIASRVIGALRSAFVRIESDAVDTLNPTAIFDGAVASLKIEPAKVEQTPPVDTRPVVKVGQVWQLDGDTFNVASVDQEDGMAYAENGTAIYLKMDGKPRGNWTLKREPFELPSQKRDSEPLSRRSWTEALDDDKNAIRDRIREIERRLEAGGL